MGTMIKPVIHTFEEINIVTFGSVRHYNLSGVIKASQISGKVLFKRSEILDAIVALKIKKN